MDTNLCHLDLKLICICEIVTGDTKASTCNLLDCTASRIPGAIFKRLQPGRIFPTLSCCNINFVKYATILSNSQLLTITPLQIESCSTANKFVLQCKPETTVYMMVVLCIYLNPLAENQFAEIQNNNGMFAAQHKPVLDLPPIWFIAMARVVWLSNEIDP